MITFDEALDSATEVVSGMLKDGRSDMNDAYIASDGKFSTSIKLQFEPSTAGVAGTCTVTFDTGAKARSSATFGAVQQSIKFPDM